MRDGGGKRARRRDYGPGCSGTRHSAGFSGVGGGRGEHGSARGRGGGRGGHIGVGVVNLDVGGALVVSRGGEVVVVLHGGGWGLTAHGGGLGGVEGSSSAAQADTKGVVEAQRNRDMRPGRAQGRRKVVTAGEGVQQEECFVYGKAYVEAKDAGMLNQGECREHGAAAALQSTQTQAEWLSRKHSSYARPA